MKAPATSKLGALAEFARAGYTCHWIRSADPSFQAWDEILSHAGSEWWISKEHTRELPKEHWSSLGMPDGQLFALGFRYFCRYLERKKPVFLGILSASNHQPYSFPQHVDGKSFSYDPGGGMRYADHCLQKLIERLRTLPDQQQPLIFITADTGSRTGLDDNAPLAYESLESVRVPGVLITPDGFLAGEVYEGLFSHQDLIDLLRLMTLDRKDERPYKFVDAHRILLPIANPPSFLLVSQNAYYHRDQKRLFVIEGRWRLREVETYADRQLIEDGVKTFVADHARLWKLPK